MTEETLPPQLIEIAVPLIIAGLAAVIGLILHAVAYRIVRKYAENTPYLFDKIMVRNLYGPTRLISVLLLTGASVPHIHEYETAELLINAMRIGWILATAWVLMRGLRIFGKLLLSKYDISEADNLRARTIQTQFRVVQRIAVLIIVVLALGGILMSFDTFRLIGTSLLASAGIAGIIIGFSAQKTLSTIVAGIQIAFTQPIRIDDVVIVEGEWGRIEEITLTYVVVRIWDLRRLVVPITYFLEQPFQNWTRTESDILGSVFLFTDYTVPVEALREELDRICREETAGLWDGEVCLLQVTDASERAMTLRALVSARDAGSAWDLRCLVREKLLQFLQQEYPEALPRVRVLPLENTPPPIPEIEGKGGTAS
jgi:small-conductance mechanosensitive channel